MYHNAHEANAPILLLGLLQSVDGYMNIALEQTREIVNGKTRREYGDAFIRGNNGMCGKTEVQRTMIETKLLIVAV